MLLSNCFKCNSPGSPWVRGCTAISILPWFASPASVGTYAGFTVVSAVGTEPPQAGSSSGWPSNVHIAVCEPPQPNKRNGRAHVPAGTSHCIRSADAKPQRLSTRRSRWNGGGTALRRRAGCRVKDAPVPPHRVHHHSEFTRQGDRSAFETNFLPQFQAPASQGAVGADAGQHPRRGLVEPGAHVLASRDVPVVGDLARLVAPRREK